METPNPNFFAFNFGSAEKHILGTVHTFSFYFNEDLPNPVLFSTEVNGILSSLLVLKFRDK